MVTCYLNGVLNQQGETENLVGIYFCIYSLTRRFSLNEFKMTYIIMFNLKIFLKKICTFPVFREKSGPRTRRGHRSSDRASKRTKRSRTALSREIVLFFTKCCDRLFKSHAVVTARPYGIKIDFLRNPILDLIFGPTA